MEDTKIELLKQYEDMSIEALLELHAAGTLTEYANAILETELRKRSVPIPEKSEQQISEELRAKAIEKLQKKHIRRWVMIFAAIGLAIPLICEITDFAMLAFCEFCWPAGFLLFAMDGHFNITIFLVSILLNSGLWAFLGWLIGYASSSRITL